MRLQYHGRCSVFQIERPRLFISLTILYTRLGSMCKYTNLQYLEYCGAFVGPAQPAFYPQNGAFVEDDQR